MPKYEEIANIIRNRIQDGTYPANSLLPNQTEFVTEFDASRMTVKKAITILTMEGLIFARRGAGTKVLDHSFWDKDTSIATQYHGLTHDLGQRGHHRIESQIIGFKVGFPTPEVKERLMLEEQQPIYQIIRLRIIDGIPTILEHSFMPVDLIPGLSNDILHHSIYAYIQSELGLKIAGAFRNIQADKPDQYDQQYLACQPTDPVLEVEQVVYLDNGRPFDYSHSRNRYDRRGYTVLDVKS